jgi:hypothetical protein
VIGFSIESHARSCTLAHALVEDLRSVYVNFEGCLVLTESRCPDAISMVNVWHYIAVLQKSYGWYVSSPVCCIQTGGLSIALGTTI